MLCVNFPGLRILWLSSLRARDQSVKFILNGTDRAKKIAEVFSEYLHNICSRSMNCQCFAAPPDIVGVI